MIPDPPKSLQEREILPRDKGSDPKATHLFQNQWYSEEEGAELERRVKVKHQAYIQECREKWEQTEHGKLCLAFYAAFQAYKTYFQSHPGARYTPYGWAVDYDEHKLFEAGLRLVADHKREREETARRNLEKAQKAARCRHEYLNGEQCGAPRVRGRKLCHMHERMEEAKTSTLDLGPIEDPDSIQVAIKRLQGAIIEGKLNHRQVGQLAYTIQLAAWNVTRTSMATRE
ncbi:MAG: hypothetical protein WA738_05480 [Candidatus Angelobacter sp.]